MAGAHVGQQGTSFPGSCHPLSYGTHAQAHTHTHILHRAHIHSHVHTHHHKHIHTWHVVQPGAGNSAQTTDSHSPLALMTQHLLKGASALLGSQQAGAKAVGGAKAGPVGGACRDQGPPRAASSLPPRCSECRDQTSGCCAD